MLNERVESLDYLRGIMAVSVMMYHYSSWSGFVLESSTFLGKLGIYAVSIFYILSGLSLAIVYKGRINQKVDFFKFWAKRLFRIVPLFWVVLTSVIFLEYFKYLFVGGEIQFSLEKIFLNYSLLFSFFYPDAYIPTGAWSIGNEIVFYLILPFLLFLNKKSSLFLYFFWLIAFFFALYFSFYVFDQSDDLVNQWSDYVNPLNQCFLFVSGVLIGHFKRCSFNRVFGCVFLFILVATFMFIPVEGGLIMIVSGLERIVFSFLCVFFVFVLYNLNFVFKGVLHSCLKFLGDCCYSIYLFHPVVAIPVVVIGYKLNMNPILLYSFSVPLTLLISWVSFRYIESYFIRLGRKAFS
jgi:exopolysaccharide production protein ExoZ